MAPLSFLFNMSVWFERIIGISFNCRLLISMCFGVTAHTATQLHVNQILREDLVAYSLTNLLKHSSNYTVVYNPTNELFQ